MRIGILASLLLAASCGPDENAPILTSLRCVDQRHCQDPLNPFLLHLQVNFSDADGDFGNPASTINVRLDDTLQETKPAAQWFAAAGLDTRATSGTLKFDLEVRFQNIEDGQRFVVAVDAKDAAGHESNQPELLMELRLE